MSSDLPILSAEHYMDAADIRPARKAEKVKKGPPTRSEDGPRKRTKTSLRAIVTEVDDDDDAADADEKSKRARGRPRLDTQDQSAADRRRTQIRLAQRAYRSRKDNAIQTLEREVKELQQTKEEMSDAFMKLHSFAMSNGFLDTIPAFAKELHSTTEKFLMLAKKSSECSGENSRATSPEKDPGASEKPPVEQPDKAMSRDVVGDQPTITGSSVWGYRFSTEAQTAPALTIPDLLIPQAAQPATTHAPMGYEIITMPTVDNASFPFEPNAQESFFAQGIHPAGHQILTPNETPPGFSLSTSASASASLPMPNTLAFAEPTFGRRLQRSTIEFACRLSSMPNPPGDRFAKAFGFCLLFEPIDQIRARLHRALEKTRQESLNNWRVPFWALGGAGQHQLGGQQHQSQQHQQQQQSDKPVGNQGTVDVEKHAFGGNFGFGPFDAGTTEARDRHVDASMHIMLPGFQGDFFDPDEVEVYLQSRGVCIQPGQDYVTAEVDMSWFEGQQQQQQQATGSYGDWASEMPPPASRTSETTTLGGNDRDWVAESVMADEQAAASLLGLADGRDLSLANQRQVVTLNVDVLIQELMYNAVCLGRTPAFRPKDVNRAFWTATGSDGILNF